MILVIDNYDSFTYNLVQLIGQFNPDLKIVRNDKITIAEIRELNPERIVLSPGPGRPEDAGICVDVIKHIGQFIPLLGVCLGHQAIGYAYGGTIIHAPTLMHGKTSLIIHHNDGIFADTPLPFEATRYHSLVIERATLPDSLSITAETSDNVIMGVKHKEFPIEGIQFHPESILTIAGPQLIKNWLESYTAK